MPVRFSDLVNKTLTKIEQDGRDEITFYCSDGSVYRMFHEQECCERVEIEEIVGELEDLVNDGPVLMAYEASNKSIIGSDSRTYTFYIIRTMHETVTIRWFGASNGYYSEKVTFERKIG